jgi:hypothetical protein
VMIDLSKPVETRCGCKVELWDRRLPVEDYDGNECAVVVGVMTNVWGDRSFEMWFDDGGFCDMRFGYSRPRPSDPLDLVNVSDGA